MGISFTMLPCTMYMVYTFAWPNFCASPCPAKNFFWLFQPSLLRSSPYYTRESAVRRNYYSNQSRVEHSSSHITHFTSSTTTTLLITHGRLKFQNYTKVRQPLLSFLCKKYECTCHNVNLKHACVYIFPQKIDADIVSII